MSYELIKTERWSTIDINRLGRLSISVLVIYYMWYNEKFGHNSLIVYGAFLLMCGSLVIDLTKDNKTLFANYHIGIWWNFVFAIYAFVTGIFTAYSYYALLEGTRLLIQYSMIAFGIYHFSNKSENGIRWLLMTINVAALLCCFSLITHPVENIRGRFSISPWNNPNTLGFALVLGVFAVAFRFKADIKWLIVFFPQVVLFLYGIIRTGSRKAFISAVLFVFLWGIEIIMEIGRTNDGWKQTVIVIAFLAILFMGARFVISTYSQSAVASRMENFLDDESNGNRINYYRLAWQILLDKPIFGGGLNQFHYWSHAGSYAHSTYAEVIADFGIFGSLIYFFPIIVSGYQLVHKMGSEDYFHTRIVLALWCVEILMGLGQIFYLDIMHYIAWTIIFWGTAHRKKIFVNIDRYKYIKY